MVMYSEIGLLDEQYLCYQSNVNDLKLLDFKKACDNKYFPEWPERMVKTLGQTIMVVFSTK